MLRRSEVPLLDTDPELFDAPPEWPLADLRRAIRENDDDGDALGLRALVERPEVLSRAWRSARGAGPRKAPRRPRRFSQAA